MASNVEKLTTGELNSSITACQFLLQMRERGILEPVVQAKLSSLLVDLNAQKEERVRLALESRAAARKQ